MISRTPITCLACQKPITARIQIGHELEQPISFACPNCGTEVRLTLILDEPPRVKIRWEENCEAGIEEGAIINIGAGFTISKDKLHKDMYFPSFDAPRPSVADMERVYQQTGRRFFDRAVETGTLPRAAEDWKIVQKAFRFHRTGQTAHRDVQLAIFWGKSPEADESVDGALFSFLLRFMEPNGGRWLKSLVTLLNDARRISLGEYVRLATHFNDELKLERFQGYVEILSEYFKAYGEFSQTLVYTRQNIALPDDAAATSSDFDKTKMFYGNAFELLGSHLDVPAALNNIISGRAYDQMKAMDLKQFRSLNKANRLGVFPADSEFLGLALEYDSIVRNASHHRWFKLNDARTEITYRSGGTGALNKMSYAQYLARCNRLIIQVMLLCCLELIFLKFSGKEL